MVTDGNRLRLDWSAEAVRGLLPSSLLPTESPDDDDRLPPATPSGLRPVSEDRDRLLPSVGTDRPSSTAGSERVSTARLRERLPTVGDRVSRPDIRGRLTRLSVRERLSTANLGDSVSTPSLSERLPVAEFGDGAAPMALGERLPTAPLGDRVSRPDIRGRFARSTLRERVPTAPLGDRLSPESGTSTAGLSERVPVPEINRDLSAPPVTLPTSDDIVDREEIEARVYDTQTTTPEYFVGVIPADHDTVVQQLADSEFGTSRITYPKTLADDIDYDESSIWVYRSWALSHFQLHVPLFEIECDGQPVVYVFYHHEYNWLRHPVNHLDAEYLNPDWERDVIVDLIEATGLTVETCADIDGEYGPAAEYCATCGDNT